MPRRLAPLAALALLACRHAPDAPPTVASTPAAPAPPAPGFATWSARDVALPGATAPASLDYIGYESPGALAPSGRVWVPVGGTGSVDVYDVASGAMTRVDGFKTAVREVRGATRTVGPSSVSLGPGFAYVGNRATREVCAVDTRSLTLVGCTGLGRSVDGVAYVAPTKEVWVTVPDEQAIVILDASVAGPPRVVGQLKVEGAPEGYAVDVERGLFFTNLEDKGKTVVIDAKRRVVEATWSLGCAADGPRGVAVDAERHVFVACTDHIEVLDGAHDGHSVGRLETGAGVDNIDYHAAKRRLYVAAGKAARLTVAEVTPAGQLVPLATATTRPGARNCVADGAGNAYVADPAGAHLLVVGPAPAAGAQ